MTEAWPDQLLFGSLLISRSTTEETASLTCFCCPCPGSNTNTLSTANVLSRKISLSPSTLLFYSPLQSSLKTTSYHKLTNYHVPAEPWSLYQHCCTPKPCKTSEKAFNTTSHSFVSDAVVDHVSSKWRLPEPFATDICNRHFQTEHAAPQLRDSFEYYKRGQSATMQSYYFLNKHGQFILTTLWELPNSTCTDSVYFSTGTEMDNGKFGNIFNAYFIP